MSFGLSLQIQNPLKSKGQNQKTNALRLGACQDLPLRSTLLFKRARGCAECPFLEANGTGRIPYGFECIANLIFFNAFRAVPGPHL
jgi:hypothetical protein